MARIVLIAGFEAFNANLYEQAAAKARRPDLEMRCFAIATSLLSPMPLLKPSPRQTSFSPA